MLPKFRERVVVFECAQQHTICYECFLQLCKTALAERHFVEHRNYGYTIRCPSKFLLCFQILACADCMLP